MALLMMQKYNTEHAYIFNTYQCYLKDAPKRVSLDMQVARIDKRQLPQKN